MQVACAEKGDADGVMQVITLCKNDLVARGIDQWDDAYPGYFTTQEGRNQR
jgi:hypothetical protein